MDTNIDRLKSFLERIKSIGWWERLVGWGRIRSLLFDASADLQKIISSLDYLKSDNQKIEGQNTLEKAGIKNLQESTAKLSTENEVLKNTVSAHQERIEMLEKTKSSLEATNSQYLKRGSELSNDLSALRQRLELLEKELRETREENSRLRKDDEFRRQEHSNAVSSLKQIQEKLQHDRESELEQRKQDEIEKLRRLKETWTAHEEQVRNSIKAICAKHTIEYISKVPFRGEPDNTIKIIDEFVVFDAKSPGSDDLSNFPGYIKTQTEALRKYVKEENVRKDIYLVVPTNTLEHFETFIYHLSDYSVFVISLDSLEPVIVSLQKIEDYEFARQLSPEERDNICRVLGKFAHLSKRRIQVDAFFAKQFFELVYRSEADLPKDILEKVTEFEKAEKINPPIERRAKQISNKELEADTTKLNAEAKSKGIVTEDDLLSKGLNKLPLYTSQEKQEATKDQASLFE